MAWHVLGFDYDAVVGAWQDWRLARQCVAVLGTAGPMMGDGILACAGDEQYLVLWYVRADVAEVLERNGVPWRRFLLGEVNAPPAHASQQLKLG